MKPHVDWGQEITMNAQNAMFDISQTIFSSLFAPPGGKPMLVP